MEVDIRWQRGLPKAPRGRQLRARRDQPLHDHRDDQVTLPAASTAEQPLQIQVAQHPQDRGDVAVGQRADDLEVRVEIDQATAGEHRADRVDDLGREVRQVPEVLVADLALRVAVGAAEQLRGVHHTALPFRPDCGYVSRTTTLCHSNHTIAPTGQTPNMTLATTNQQKKGPTPTNTGDRASNPQKLPTRCPRRHRWGRRCCRSPGHRRRSAGCRWRPAGVPRSWPWPAGMSEWASWWW